MIDWYYKINRASTVQNKKKKNVYEKKQNGILGVLFYVPKSMVFFYNHIVTDYWIIQQQSTISMTFVNRILLN